ncbi:quinol:cytochrome C oxidoreductase [Mucilaginibacter sp.]
MCIALGVLGILFGFLYKGGAHAERTFSNLLLMSYYFACICICGIFFCAIQYVSQSGWSASIIRVPQAFAKILPVASIILIAIAAAGLLITHTYVEDGKTVTEPFLYGHWATAGLTTKGSANFDAIIAGKSAFLNRGTFFLMLVAFLGAYSILGRMLVNASVSEDSRGGMFYYNKSFKYSVIFLVVLGFTFPLFAFAVIMSLEAHWFSTMFGWYNLSAMHVTGLSAIALTLIWLREKGYAQWVNSNHLHDLGKLMFGFSIFWTYLWFSQFFLTWYSNIPEESVYFYKRWEPEFKWLFWLNIVINFLAPLLLLMSRDAKRMFSRMKIASIVIILGHWLDYYLMIMPGTVGPEGRGFGVEEICIFLGFAGLFVFLMLNTLSKFDSLVPKKHPFLEESLHHHI